MRVCDLTPGDTFDIPGSGQAIFVARCMPHPLYPGLALVVWRMPGRDAWSHDALDLFQDVGEPLPIQPADRLLTLRAALLGPPPTAGGSRSARGRGRV